MSDSQEFGGLILDWVVQTMYTYIYLVPKCIRFNRPASTNWLEAHVFYLQKGLY